MIKRILAMTGAFSLFVISCEVTSNEGVVVKPGVTQIGNVTFTVDTTYMLASPGTLVASGTARNDGSGTISSPWYVQCSFFSDSTESVVLGSGNAQIGVPLSPGQSAYWTIRFSSDNVDVRGFPEFCVDDFRATYSN